MAEGVNGLKKKKKGNLIVEKWKTVEEDKKNCKQW